MKVHGEIIYTRFDGVGIHSDICPNECRLEEFSEDYRKFLHKVLDEWLDESNGTGIFYLKSSNSEEAVSQQEKF